MKRVGYGKSYKIKGDMQFGLAYPILCEEMVPGEIRRVKPEVFVQSVVPPTVQLTDNIKWKIEFAFVPNRLVDDTFVRNITTTKDGTVKGNFKTWSLKQINNSYGSRVNGVTSPKRKATIAGYGTNECFDLVPLHFSEKNLTDALASHTGVSNADHRFKYTNFYSTAGALPTGNTWCYTECLPMIHKDKTKSRSAPWFGQGSLMDWLRLEPNGNIGQFGYDKEIGDNDFTFNTWAISAYYMICNFWHTNVEYEKYIAPYFDYVYAGRDNSENRTTLHRYETLEEEFGNTFEEPRLSGRCVNGLFIDNWTNDYFANTMKTPQRGVAPVVPVSVSGRAYTQMLAYGSGTPWASQSNISLNTNGAGTITDSSATYLAQTNGNQLSAGFVISDLRSALALQHFQEDTQDCFKWSDWLQKVYGISPSDLTLDEPAFIGACSGYLASDSVISMSSTAGAELGELGGKLGTYNVSSKMFTYRAEEHGTLMAIMTIKPERNYESGVDKMYMRKNYLDMYFKYLTGIGNQGIALQELCAVQNGSSNSAVHRFRNIAFTSRFEEFRHSRNKVVGKCRNSNLCAPVVDSTGSALDSNQSYSTLSKARDNNYEVPYLNTFHPYAVGDAYIGAQTFWNTENAIIFNQIDQNFLLCCPQMNDVFVDDTESPFMVVVGFNGDVLSPIPAFTQAGVSYV